MVATANYITIVTNGTMRDCVIFHTFALQITDCTPHIMNTNKTYSVLLADDDSDEIELLVESFEDQDRFKIVFVAKNGVEVVDYITENPNTVDIIISDMFMPAMTGLEALEKLMSSNLVKETLTVIFSNTVNVENQEKFAATRLLKFYTKPSSITEYNRLPEKLINIFEANSQQ